MWCLCGNTKDEKPDPSGNAGSQGTNGPSKATRTSLEVPGRSKLNTGDQESVVRLASTRPSDSLNELTHEPEEQFGKQYLITDESIDRHASSYRTLTQRSGGHGRGPMVRPEMKQPNNMPLEPCIIFYLFTYLISLSFSHPTFPLFSECASHL